MWLVVGLGNPDARYRGTRHNVGFEIAEALAERAGITLSEKKFKARMARGRLGSAEVVILEPQTYMNLSGESVGPAMGFYKLTTEQVVVVHDDLELELGRMKLRRGGGHSGHNGLRSLVQHLPDAEFVRVRIGIGRPPSGWDPADYVLGKFTPDERALVEPVLARATDAVETVVKEGLTRALNRFNRDPQEGRGSKKDDAAGASESKRQGRRSDAAEDAEVEPSSREKERGNGQHA